MKVRMSEGMNVRKCGCGPTTLSLGKPAELGPLEPAPAYSQMSLRDGIDVRLRGGIQRAPATGGAAVAGGLSGYLSRNKKLF